MPENIFYESEARGSSRPAKPKPREANPRQSSLPTDGPRLHRRRRVSNQLYVDPRIIPEGYTYEWKAESIYGQPNTEHMVELRENHWRAVPASRHPELAAAGDTVIRRAGTVLHERPSYLTEEAQMEQIEDSLKPLRQKEELMYGTPPSHPNSLPRDKRGYINRVYSPSDPPVEFEDGTYSER